MIVISNTAVTGFDAAFRGMRNPMNSWEKSDSAYFCDDCEKCPWQWLENCDAYHVGEADMTLAKKLIAAGDDHGKFLRMINVSCDIEAPLYWIAEHDTYKIGTVRDSCSFMHRGLSRPFSVDDFSKDDVSAEGQIEELERIVDTLNVLRKRAMQRKEQGNRAGYESLFRTIRQLLPQGYMMTYTWSANYAVLRKIYHARKNHRLPEWHYFCRWVESLPYAYDLLV